MTVYDHIDSNRRRTALILALFPLALLACTVCACAVLVKLDVLKLSRDAGFWTETWNLTVTAFPWLTGIAFLWVFFSYRWGDDIILSTAGACELAYEDNPTLFGMVVEVAIMAGLPRPKIYLIDDESLNAFATGRTPDTASVALTAGIAGNLKPAELEAVIAHEMGHIGNRDTRLMSIVVIGIAMFTFLAEMTFRLALGGGSGRKSRNSSSLRSKAVLLVAASALWIFGMFVAPLIRMALSRNREFLADATSARITHNPDALADALEAISKDPRVESLDSRPLMGALCVANPLSTDGLLSGLYASHPPIEERIARLRRMARDL
jgi:heat shock protein HtpX